MTTENSFTPLLHESLEVEIAISALKKDDPNAPKKVFDREFSKPLQEEMLEWKKQNPNKILLLLMDNTCEAYHSFEEFWGFRSPAEFCFVFREDHDNLNSWLLKNTLEFSTETEKIEKSKNFKNLMTLYDTETLVEKIAKDLPNNMVYLTSLKKVLIYPKASTSEEISTKTEEYLKDQSVADLKKEIIYGKNKISKNNKFEIKEASFLLLFIRKPKFTFFLLNTNDLTAILISNNKVNEFMKNKTISYEEDSPNITIDQKDFLIGRSARNAFLRLI